MGYKNVCLTCKIAFSEGSNAEHFNKEKNCPNCGEKMVFVSQKFKPPKKSDTKAWEMVRLLIENGFYFQSVYTPYPTGGYIEVEYPKTLSEAREFIKKYGKLNDE